MMMTTLSLLKSIPANLCCKSHFVLRYLCITLRWENFPPLHRRHVIGILKVGTKNLFIYDMHGVQHEMAPLCVLDFYVHESRQRQGCGRKLFDFMLAVRAKCVNSSHPSFALFLRSLLAMFLPPNRANHSAVGTRDKGFLWQLLFPLFPAGAMDWASFVDPPHALFEQEDPCSIPKACWVHFSQDFGRARFLDGSRMFRAYLKSPARRMNSLYFID